MGRADSRSPHPSQLHHITGQTILHASSGDPGAKLVRRGLLFIKDDLDTEHQTSTTDVSNTRVFRLKLQDMSGFEKRTKSQMTYRIESILEYLPLSLCLKRQPVSYYDFADFGTNSTN